MEKGSMLAGSSLRKGASILYVAVALSATAACVAPAFAQDGQGPVEQLTRNYVEVDRTSTSPVRDFESGETVRYVCADGRSFAVRFDKVHGASTALVRYANSGENSSKGTLLLVAGPTGSGVRYTNDAAVFHTKGVEGWLSVPETAGTIGLEARDCAQVPQIGEKSLTQGALAGQYRFAIDQYHPGQYDDAHFTGAETICFVARDADYFAVVPTPGAFPARYYVTLGKDTVEFGNMRVGEVDAGAGRRSYPIDLGYPGTLTMNFAAPGMIDGTVRGMSGLSSITAPEGDRLDCIDGAGYLYVGAFDERIVTVELTEQGTLTYAEWPRGSGEAQSRIDGGFITYDEGRTEFHFFREDDTLIRLVATDGDTMRADDNFVRGPSDWLEFTPRAYFIADPAVYLEKVEQLPPSTALVLGAVETCNHLAGEYGEDPERNLQISDAQERYECRAVGDYYDLALSEAPNGSQLRKWLEGNRPIWR